LKLSRKVEGIDPVKP